MSHSIGRSRRGIIKANPSKQLRILRRLTSPEVKLDGRKLADEDLVWLSNDEWRRIDFDRLLQKLEELRKDLARARDARDAAEEVERLWNELETHLRSVHVAASLDQGFEEDEIDEAKVTAQMKVILPENGIADPEKERVVIVLTDDLNKGVNDDGTPNLEKYKNVLTIRIILAAAKATKLPYNIYVVEANSLRFRQNTSKPSPWPHPKSNFEKICRIVLIEQLKDIKPVAIFLHSSPARGMFGQEVGTPVFAAPKKYKNYDLKKVKGLKKVGGLEDVAEAVGWPILVEGFNHPAQARFFKAFWEWAKIAADAARK